MRCGAVWDRVGARSGSMIPAVQRVRALDLFVAHACTSMYV